MKDDGAVGRSILRTYFPLLLAAAPLKAVVALFCNDIDEFSAAFSGGPIEGRIQSPRFASIMHFPLLLAAAPLKATSTSVFMVLS